MTLDDWIIASLLAVMFGVMIFFQVRGMRRENAMYRQWEQEDAERYAMRCAVAERMKRLADEMAHEHQAMPMFDPEVRP